MRKLVADEIAATLKEGVASGRWGDALRLPAERDLAAEFGVSRNTMRLALQRLEEAGILVRQVGRGRSWLRMNSHRWPRSSNEWKEQVQLMSWRPVC